MPCSSDKEPVPTLQNFPKYLILKHISYTLIITIYSIISLIP